MIEINYLVLALSALIPMIMGFIWYHPKVAGSAWMKEVGFTEESMEGSNMPLIFGLSYVFSFFLAFTLYSLSVHQMGIFSTFGGPEMLNEPAMKEGFEKTMALVGDNFRTFGHGALHGGLAGLFFALPILGTNALFERKSFKYIAINVAYWAITMALMGGVVCQFA